MNEREIVDGLKALAEDLEAMVRDLREKEEPPRPALQLVTAEEDEA
jgi:hypothetical protein